MFTEMKHTAKIETAWQALLAAKAYQEANTVTPTVDHILSQVGVAANEGKFELLIGKHLKDVPSDQKADVYGRLRSKGFNVERAAGPGDAPKCENLTEIKVSWREARQPATPRSGYKD